MRPIQFRAGILFALALASPAWAWNYSGHWVAAAIAYQRLSPSVRAHVDELIRRHPDYDKFNFPDAPSDPESRARAAFIRAASWPDEIKGDPRFYDDTRKDAAPTPTLPGLPDMKRHTNWHYTDIPFSPDDTPLVPARVPNAVTEIRRLLAELSPTADPSTAAYDPAAAAYDLVWLQHLIPDIHNPLHGTSRFTKDLPGGDQGGNLVFVPGKTLHMVWDDAATPADLPYAAILKYAKDFMGRQPPPVTSTLNPKVWIEEDAKLAKSDVYTFGDGSGTKEHPVTLPSGYMENAQRIARQRLTRSGYILGAALNARLR